MTEDGRVILNAALDNIAKEIDVEENVADAIEVISAYSKSSDNTLYFLRDRPDSRFLREDLAYQDLTIVGYYRMSRKKKRRSQVISFQKSDWSIEFYFIKTEVDIAAHLFETIKSGRVYSAEEITQIVVGAGLKNKSATESLVGHQARSLDSYILDHVDVTTCTPLVFLGYPVFNFTRKLSKTVYQTNSQ